MTLEEIGSLWLQDGKIDITEIGEEVARIPLLHHKYFMMLSNERIRLRAVEAKLAEFERDAHEYYSSTGNLSQETMDQWGWPYRLPYKITLKEDRARYIKADSKYTELIMKVATQEAKVEFLSSILKSITYRSQALRVAVDFRKLEENVS